MAMGNVWAWPSRVYGYEHALYQFDSKYVTQPGNAKAIEFLARTLRSWGYELVGGCIEAVRIMKKLRALVSIIYDKLGDPRTKNALLVRTYRADQRPRPTTTAK